MIKVYMLDVSTALDPTQLMMISARLSAARQEKIARQHFEKDRKLSLGAGILLNLGLQEYGLEEQKVRIDYGTLGKPYFPDHPEIHFNLSHSGTIAMAVFADREVGCDVEEEKKPAYQVSKRFFSRPEQDFLAAAENETEQDERFFRIWTLKESFLKVTGEGTHFPLDRFCVHLDGEKPCLTIGGQPADYILYEYALPGYRAAVCLEGSKTGESDDVFFSFQNLQDVV